MNKLLKTLNLTRFTVGSLAVLTAGFHNSKKSTSGLLAIMITSALFCFSSSAFGVSYIFDFSSPLGILGTTQTYTNNSVTITAGGFTNPSTPTALFGKNAGADEMGVGISGTTDNEIDTGHWVQLDLTNLLLNNLTSLALTIDSAQPTETWSVYGSNTAGNMGSFLSTHTGPVDSPLSLLAYVGTYKFFSVQAASCDSNCGNNNVLINSITADGNATVPEPATLLLLGSGIAAVIRKRLSASKA